MSAFTWPPEPESPSPVLGERRGAPAEPPAGHQIAAAVLVPLFVPGDLPQPHVVLTRRRPDLRSHAGEISFPGGRRDPEDADLAATALREAEEEIGLPRERVRLLGELEPTSTLVTGYLIHPFVCSIPEGLAWKLSPREVDAVIELPLQAIHDGRTRTRLERRGIAFETDAFVVGEHLIWGATARILEHLLERMRGGGLPGLATPWPAAG